MPAKAGIQYSPPLNREGAEYWIVRVRGR